MIKSLIALAFLFLPTTVLATECDHRTAIMDLIELVQEELVASAYRRAPFTGEDELYEVFRSDSGTWTAVATDARGISCIIDSGIEWESH